MSDRLESSFRTANLNTKHIPVGQLWVRFKLEHLAYSFLLVIIRVWSFVLFNDARSQKGHLASNVIIRMVSTLNLSRQISRIIHECVKGKVFFKFLFLKKDLICACSKKLVRYMVGLVADKAPGTVKHVHNS